MMCSTLERFHLNKWINKESTLYTCNMSLCIEMQMHYSTILALELAAHFFRGAEKKIGGYKKQQKVADWLLAAGRKSYSSADDFLF
jgi:hypothetical protein